MGIKGRANTYMLLVLVLGALMPVMLNLSTGSGGMNTYEFLFLTYALSVPVSLAFVFAVGKRAKLVSYLRNRRDLALISAIGILNYAFLELGLTTAEKFVGASLATVVYRTSPLLMLLFLPLVLRERISVHQIAALLLAFAGLYIALTGGSLSIFSNANIGIIIMLIGIALAGALATVLIKRFTFDMESGMFIFALANFVFFSIVFSVGIMNGMALSPISLKSLIAILYVGAVYNVFVGFMFYGALRMMKTTFVTNIMFLSPFITFLFSSAILGEPVYLYYLAIAALVTVGILIQRLDKKGSTYAVKDKSRARAHGYRLYDVTSAFINASTDAMQQTMKSGGRVLAVKLEKNNADKIKPMLEVPEAKNLLLYTDSDSSFVKPDQHSFISDLVGKSDGETVLMSAGDPDESERVLGDALINLKGPSFDVQSSVPREPQYKE